MNHDQFVSVAVRCWSRKGALEVVQEVHDAILSDQPSPVTEDVRAAAGQSSDLVQSVRLWMDATRIDEGVHALLQALDGVVVPRPGVERARDMLRAMLLITSELVASQARGESIQEDPEFMRRVEKERRGRVWR